LQTIDALTVRVSISHGSLVFFFERLELLSQLCILLGKILTQRSLVHGENFPILHSLLRVLELFSGICFPGDELVALLDPVLLGQGRSGPEAVDFLGLCLILLPQLGELILERVVILLKLADLFLEV
jgi:hypothetical protein